MGREQPKPIPESQRLYNAARIDIVIGAVSEEWQTFNAICERLGATGTIYDEGGSPITRAETMIALHRLVKGGGVERRRLDNALTTMAEYRLAP